ncbi:MULTISPECIES: hypothetical protein [Eikenella]|uniref:Immunity protein 30 domain-containing protein n=1 Tax=Eikenella longinqua TaxID=1795827 RepID=A0A1A9S0K8_9NEIS|nr:MULTISPECIES: hypothetical protein [Eikenella]OAM30053.1 hypothetical protein A7P95_03275 [Eikenella longinqua]
MKNVLEYNRILSKYRGDFDNYWYDYLVFNAIEIIDKFNDSEWEFLLNDLKNKKDELWYVAFIDTLSEIENFHNALASCILIFDKSSYEVQVSIIDTMNSILGTKKVTRDIMKKIKYIVVDFAPKSSIDSIVFHSLLSKLDHSK